MNSKVKTLLIFAIIAGIGFVVTYFLKGAIDTTLQPFRPAFEPSKINITTAISNIQTTWASIPNEIKGVVALGIPTAFAMFFAWTKTRAMNKLQQTQMEAQKQFTQMSGEAKGAQEQIKLLEQQKQALQTQISQQANSTSQDLVAEAQQMVTAKQRQLDEARSTITDLEALIERLKVTEKIVYK